MKMAEVILELSGSDSPVEHRGLPVDDPKVRQPDISRARKELGWSPSMDIREGVKLTLEDFRDRLGAA